MEEALVEDPFRVNVHYRLDFEDGASAEFVVDTDLKSREPTPCSGSPYEWQRLSTHRCAVCPPSMDDEELCPAISAVLDIIEYFNRHPDHSRAKCTVTLPGKTVTADQGLQEALSALIGLRLASSTCPVLSRLKPLARFHNPFVSPYQTVFRAASMHLLGEYFRMQDGGTPDWTLAGLRKYYDDIGEVNVRISQRLKEARESGSSPVSMMILSVFSVTMSHLFDEHLAILKELYES